MGFSRCAIGCVPARVLPSNALAAAISANDRRHALELGGEKQPDLVTVEADASAFSKSIYFGAASGGNGAAADSATGTVNLTRREVRRSSSISNIHRKLKVANRTKAARWAWGNGVSVMTDPRVAA